MRSLIFFSLYVETHRIFYTCSSSPFALVTFQVLDSYCGEWVMYWTVQVQLFGDTLMVTKWWLAFPALFNFSPMTFEALSFASLHFCSCLSASVAFPPSWVFYLYSFVEPHIHPIR